MENNFQVDQNSLGGASLNPLQQTPQQQQVETLTIIYDKKDYLIVIYNAEILLQQNVNPDILLLLLKSCLELDYYQRCLDYLAQYWVALQSPQEPLIWKINQIKITCYSKLNLVQEQIEIMESIQTPANDLKRARRKKSVESRRKEAKDVMELMRMQDAGNYMEQDGCPVFLIPMKWFNQWKRHTFFDEVSTEGRKMDGLEGNSDDSAAHDYYPGQIDPSGLYQIVLNTLKDPDPVKAYTNQYLKFGLQPNVDFFVLSKFTQDYLFKLYGAPHEFKRLIISISDEPPLNQIEYNLKTFYFVCLPNISPQSMKISISRKETMVELKDKIVRGLGEIGVDSKYVNKSSKIKFWKLDQETNITLIINDLKKSSDLVPIQAKQLEPNTNLEESDLCDQDTIIVEFFQSGWRFKLLDPNNKKSSDQCSQCGRSQNLMNCRCLIVKYCSKECQKQHLNDHKDECRRIVNETEVYNIQMKKCSITPIKKYNSSSKRGLSGLQNLGNTCFMNSSLQCLSNVIELTDYLINNKFVKDLNLNNPLGSGGIIASSYAELLKEMWIGDKSYVSAWDLKKIIGKFAPQFSNFAQQDSQELLSYMLDGIHEDLNKILSKPTIESIESDGTNVEEIAQKSWENYLRRNQSIITDLMVGQFKSTLICPTCKRVSITFDPFMSVPLPLTQIVQQVSIKLYFVVRDPNISPHKLELSFPASGNAQELLDDLSRKLKIPIQYIEVNLQADYKIVQIVTPETKIKQIAEFDGLVFGYELMSPQYDKQAIASRQKQRILFTICKGPLKVKGKNITYQRIIYFQQDTTHKTIHLSIFQLLRPFLLNLQTKTTVSDLEFDTKFDGENKDQLEKEYDSHLKQKQAPYKLQLVSGEKFNVLEYIGDVLKVKEGAEIYVVLKENFQIDHMKLNRCQDYVEEAGQSGKSNTMTLNDCFNLFTQEEVLEEGNEWYCSVCKKHQNATKKMELYKIPKILILHLKRFKTNRVFNIGQTFFSGGNSKINTVVVFPGTDQQLEMTNYCKSNQSNLIYELIAVSNHMGGINGGHYTAYAKNSYNDKWFEFNDTQVSPVSHKQIVSDAAYVLFYRQKI